MRIADQIQHDLAELIQREIKSPTMGLVTLQLVTLTPDYAHVKIYLTVLDAESEVAGAILDEKAGYLYSLLLRRLYTHMVSTLHFRFDGPVERGIGMSHLTDEANATRAKDN